MTWEPSGKSYLVTNLRIRRFTMAVNKRISARVSVLVGQLSLNIQLFFSISKVQTVCFLATRSVNNGKFDNSNLVDQEFDRYLESRTWFRLAP